MPCFPRGASVAECTGGAVQRVNFRVATGPPAALAAPRPEGPGSGRLLPPFAQAPAQPALDERLQLAFEHGLGVADLDAGPYVLDQRVRLHDVVADLAAELGRHHVAPQFLAPA